MRNKIIRFLLSLCLLFSVFGCSNKDSSFSVTYIDVGQGDSALVECDGKFMLIDGGDTSASQKIQNMLVDKKINELDVLVISHLHQDHYGGLIKGLDNITTIDLTLWNEDDDDGKNFIKFSSQVNSVSKKIKIPEKHYKFELGSAKVEVLYSDVVKDNDSLVLVITYGETSFLFMGDTPQETESKIIGELEEKYPSLVLKVGHHGSQYSTSIKFLDELKSRTDKLYAVISTDGEHYEHPHSNTLSRLEQAKVKLYRTDVDGTITVKSNGQSVSFETEK